MLGPLLKARPRSPNLLSATPQEPRQGQSPVTPASEPSTLKPRLGALATDAFARNFCAASESKCFLLDKGLLMLTECLFTQIFLFSAVWLSLRHPKGEACAK